MLKDKRTAFYVRTSEEMQSWTFDSRSPENPKKFLVKRLLALEGDWITVPGEVDIHKIPVVSNL